LISAFALGHQEAQVALREYRAKFANDKPEKNWTLEPSIKAIYAEKRFSDAHPKFQEMVRELLKGLEIAKEKAGFP